MKPPIATSEASARPSIGRPTANPEDVSKRRVLIHYRRNGTVLKTRVKEAMTASMDSVKNRLEINSRFDFSHTILVRRALDLYLRQVAKFTDDQMAMEASILQPTH